MMNHKRQQLQTRQFIAKKQKKTTSSNSSNVSRLIAYLQLCNNSTAVSASAVAAYDRRLDAPEPSASSLLIISRLLRTGNTIMELLTMVSSCCSWPRSSCSPRRRRLLVGAKDHCDEDEDEDEDEDVEEDVEEDYNDDDDDPCDVMNLISKKDHLNATTLGLLLSAIYQNELCQESTEHLLAKSSCKISCGSSHTRTNSYHSDDNTMMQPQPCSKRINPYFILHFVVQILHNRYKDVLYVPLLQNHDESTMLEMMACWKSIMRNGQCPCCTTCSSSSCELFKCRHLGGSAGKVCHEMSQEEFWIPCIAFMMASQIFKKRLESKCYIVRKTKDCHSSLKCEFSCYIFSKDKKEEILMDPVMVGVMRLIHWSNILAFGMRRFWNHQEDNKDNDHNNNDQEMGTDIHKRENPLRLFFSKELDWIDMFVSWIMEETTTLSCPTHKDDTSCAFVMDCNGHGKDQEKNNPDTNRQEDTSCFQQLWAYFENHSDDDVQGSKEYITSTNGMEDASHQDVKMASCKQRSTEKTYVMNAVALRPELWKMSKNAISQDIAEMTEKIITLLNKAGSEDGAMGIEMVAAALATGNTTKQQQTDNADLEQLYIDIFPFSDSLLAGITKKYVTEEMSSARIFSFLGSFVLPSIIALASKESRPVSRQLVTMLINLARDRPCEVMGALVIPTMQGTKHLTPTQHEKVTKENMNSKGQSELITRLIKSKCFRAPELSKLASELVRVEWTDQSIAVFMTCLQRKPSLCPATFSALVERICICCDEKVLVGSTNYSSFFHTIVTKYSTQVKQEEHVETLLTAANSLTTFLKKTIISVLMKMKSV